MLELKKTAAEIRGLPEEEAIKILKAQNRHYRVVRRDKEDYTLIMNYCAARFNLEIDDGIVTRVKFG